MLVLVLVLAVLVVVQVMFVLPAVPRLAPLRALRLVLPLRSSLQVIARCLLLGLLVVLLWLSRPRRRPTSSP